MKQNNLLFAEEYAYTYDEVIKELTSQSDWYVDKTELVRILSKLGLIVANSAMTSIIANKLALSFLDTGAVVDKVSQNAIDVINKIWSRYSDHYAVVVSFETDFADACKKFFQKLCNILDYTFDKYDTILSAYQSQKSHLLDKLQRVRDEDKTTSDSENHYIRKGTNISTENESGSQVAGSKTPQTINTTGDFDAINGYWDNYDKAHDSGTSSSTGSETDDGSSSRSGTEGLDATESFDPMTAMARIDEIQTQYENTMFKWVEEFDRLFIEEGNI